MADIRPTLLDILNKTSEYFKVKGVENHRLDAQLLLGHVLGMKRMELYMNFDRPLDETELTRYRSLVKRRGTREPLQYLLEEMPFREITLKVDGRALIPRQETELIVDLVRKSIQPGRLNSILEIGVGAGPIYLSLLKELSNCNIYGTDISESCIELTLENAKRNNLVTHNILLGDLFSAFPIDQKWDIIVSNPPYIGKNQIPVLQPEVREYDPLSALIGGTEGWELPKRLIEASFSRLNNSGILILEIGIDQFSILKEKTAIIPWESCVASLDYNGIERFIIYKK